MHTNTHAYIDGHKPKARLPLFKVSYENSAYESRFVLLMHPVFSHCVMTCGSFQTPCQFNLWKQHILDGWVVDLMLKLCKTGWKSTSDSRHYITFFLQCFSCRSLFKLKTAIGACKSSTTKKWIHFNLFSVILLSVFLVFFNFLIYINIIELLLLVIHWFPML